MTDRTDQQSPVETCVSCRSHGWVCPTDHPDRMSYAAANAVVWEQDQARNDRRRIERLQSLSTSELVRAYAKAVEASYAAATYNYSRHSDAQRHALATRCAEIAAEGETRGLVVRGSRLVRPRTAATR